jgi:hypothetical protein
MKYLKILGVLVLVVAIAGAYFFPSSTSTTVKEIVGSPNGTVSTSVDGATIVFSMANGTSTSILNPTGQLAYVYGSLTGCNTVGSSQTAFTGAGLASLTMLIGTSSAPITSATPSFSPFAEVGNITIATSSTTFLEASSTTQTATSSTPILWPAGTYMSFVTNATNTAVCTVGVSTFGS